MRIPSSLIAGLTALAVAVPTMMSAQTIPETSTQTSCGPYMDTYKVVSLQGFQGDGIRCVKWTNDPQPKPSFPVLAWYGEGIWNGCTYRHVGHAFTKVNTSSTSTLVGFASDMFGNGECAKGNFPGNLTVTIVDENTIRVTGSWAEEWQRVSGTDYAWLPTPKSCGTYMTSYTAYSVTDAVIGNGRNHLGESGKGLRCELRVGSRYMTWVGFGHWGNTTYSHLGTKNARGLVGSSDFCKAGEFCGSARFGGLERHYSTILGGYVIRGWHEVWKR